MRAGLWGERPGGALSGWVWKSFSKVGFLKLSALLTTPKGAAAGSVVLSIRYRVSPTLSTAGPG